MKYSIWNLRLPGVWKNEEPMKSVTMGGTDSYVKGEAAKVEKKSEGYRVPGVLGFYVISNKA